jgi:hypothetical protein
MKVQQHLVVDGGAATRSGVALASTGELTAGYDRVTQRKKCFEVFCGGKSRKYG